MMIYANILRHILTSAIFLQRLSVQWNVMHELRRLSALGGYRLESLILKMELYQIKREYVDGSMLTLLFPRLHHLSVINGHYPVDNNLVDMIHNLVGTFLSKNQFFKMLHISCQPDFIYSSTKEKFVLTELSKRLLLTRDNSTYNVQFSDIWPSYELSVWL